MQNSFWKRLIFVCFLFYASAILCSCKAKEEPAQPALEAKVELAHQSVYVWNQGTQPWTGGFVFLGERSLNIKKLFGTVNPKGFAQLPLREFKQNSRPVSEDALRFKFVWVEAKGYAPKKFTVSNE